MIESDIEMPKDEVPKKARKPRKVKETAPNPAASLIAALKFVKPAQSKTGTPEQQHCIISGHWMAATNGVLTIACPVEDDLNACPQSTQLLDALLKCGRELSITQLTQHALSVKSGEFKGLIPCCDFSELSITGPDPQIAAIDDRIKTALGCVMCLASDGAPSAVLASVLLQSGVAVASSGVSLLEYWHGIDLPPGLLMPKASAAAIAKCDKRLSGFGYSQNSATFYFEDGSFIKTQLFNERYVNYSIAFKEVKYKPVPANFFKAVKAIESFSADGIIYFDEHSVSSHEQESEASTFKIEGLPEGMAFNSKLLLQVEHAFKSAVFDKTDNKVYYCANDVRGVTMGVELQITDKDVPY